MQLLETEQAVDQARKSSKSHEILITQRVQEFQEKQADIDNRLRKITDSDNSDETVERFEESMQKLRNLDIAKGYFELLQEVDNLRYWHRIKHKIGQL